MKIAVIIPCFKVRDHIIKLISEISYNVNNIYIIDDCCPEKSGQFVKENISDPRVIVIFHNKNLGVGGAVKTGYRQALEDGCEIMVKLDGDGQMDPNLISQLIKPIINGKADFVKGNRFHNITTLLKMPRIRLIGNSILSLINKIVTGYWNIMDPTNGFIAIHHFALKQLPLDKIENRYFFESDMLFRLSSNRAVVTDFIMDAKYQNEKSSLNIKKVLFEFPPKYFIRFNKRIFYNYFLRDFNIASIELIFGIILFLFGFSHGLNNWIGNSYYHIPTPSGTVMLAALPIILGFQLLLSALNFDINNVPKTPLQDYSKN
ncbi:MAG: glycosyltransferase family 2 protein [Bacteroidia bacterium]|nr:glycosyltransferase family 2 protein [Bacteroidia bacterium]